CADAVHLVGETGDLGSRNVRIERAVANEDPRLDCARLGWPTGREAAVDADHAFQLETAARELQNGHPAKAIPHSAQLAVHVRMGAQRIEGWPSPATEAEGICLKVPEAAHDRFAVANDALAVHVAGERHEAGFGKASSAAFRVLVQAGSTVDDEDAGASVPPR